MQRADPPPHRHLSRRKFPVGRLSDGQLVMPRIRRDLYDNILEAAQLADKRLAAGMKAGAAQQSILIKQMINEANAALADLRNRRASALPLIALGGPLSTPLRANRHNAFSVRLRVIFAQMIA
jgi:hypothetical protein